MASSRIASRYSKSLLDLATQANALEQVKEDMDMVLQICGESKDLNSLLNSPIVKTADKQQVLAKVFGSCSETTRNFINFLVEKRREAELALVAEQFIAAYDQMKGIARATVISAIPLSKEALDKLGAYVKGMIGSGEIEMVNEVDASIIGGVVIKHEDKLLDMSVAKELREIRKELIFN